MQTPQTVCTGISRLTTSTAEDKQVTRNWICIKGLAYTLQFGFILFTAFSFTFLSLDYERNALCHIFNANRIMWVCLTVAQELSTIDKSRQRYYIIGYNDTSDKTNLVGWDLKKKEVFVDTTLPLSESEFVVRVLAHKCQQITPIVALNMQ